MQNFSFSGKVALVTGAGVGIGFEIARQLAAYGAAVLINDIDETAAHSAKENILKEGGVCELIVGDSSDVDLIDRMIEKALHSFGHLDLTVANSGITTFGDFLAYSLESFQRLVAVNLQGTFFLAQRAARQMIKQQSGGSILLMSSVTGHQYHPHLTAYGMSKAAIGFLAKTLGVELAPYAIRVNAISPGATLTERTGALADQGEYQRQWEQITPLGACAEVEDIAQAALFLLSSLARHITSQTLIIDGGWTAVSPPPGL